MESNDVPAWLNDTVITGLQYMVALRLPFCPAEDVIPATCMTWVDLFWFKRKDWDEHKHKPIIERAFKSVACRVDSWPPPSMVFDEVKAISRELMTTPRVEYTMSKEQRQKNAERLSELKKKLGGQFNH